jgi:hypothetical protein
MKSEAALQIERLILEAWDMGMTNLEVIEHVLSEVSVSRDIVETIMIDLIQRMAE